MKLQARGMLVLLTTLCLTSLAGATPAEDVERGTSIQITQFGFILNGSYEAGPVFLPKSPTSLDTFIDARAFGIAVDLRIPLRGSRSGNTITWTFDVSPSPAMDIGWPNTLVRLRGSLVAHASVLPNDADPRCGGLPCPYTVWLTSLPASEATVTIATAYIRHDHRIENIRFAGLGGLPRARLQQFVLNRRGRFCSRAIETYISGRVVTTFSAPPGGAWISINSSDPLRARVAGVTVREGEQSAPFGIYLAPNWSGELILTASAGGVTRPIALTVEPPSVCALIHGFSISTAIGSCFDCFRPLWLNSAGDVLGELDGKQVFLRRDWKQPKPLREVFRLSEDQINPLRLNNQGQLIGSVTAKNRSVAFFVDMGIEAKPINFSQVFEEAEVTAANDLGIVVGTRSLSTRPIAFYSNGSKQVDIPVKAEWSRAVAVNNREEVVGNLGDGKRSRAFVFYRGIVELIDIVGEGDNTATALSEAGHVVGFADFNGQMFGFLARRSPKGGWDTIEIAGLPGFDDIRPTAVNAFGVVVGTARSKTGATTAFLHSAQTGLIDLNKVINSQNLYVTSVIGPTILEAVTINDVNEILVVGDLDGKTVRFILRPTSN